MSTTENGEFKRWWFRAGRFQASHALLLAFAVISTLPFLWMIFASFKPLNEIELLNPLPTQWRPENYTEVWDSKDISFKKYYFNSVFVAGWVTLLTCFTSSLAGYAFARMKWPGRDSIFKLYLATMMIPAVVTMIPNYTLMVKLHLLDSYAGLIVPASFSAFGTFLVRQFMLTVSPSLDEAATIDGASHWRIYWDIILPLARPGLIVLSLFTFMGNYGSFFWPLVLIKSEHLRTLPIGMVYFDTVYGQQTNLIMAASVMNIAPLIVLFVVMQKYLVQGIQLGAVKG
ncbi:MAG: carbohydrate ABC transporter permease [Candidatus Hydrogenedentes bacterium]|nr:carbohydrate ABC transporter permease [Candidatus Hydrogenedentota bacterium]